MQTVARLVESSKRTVISLYGSVAGRRSYLPDIDTVPTIKANSIRFYANTPNTIIRFDSELGEGYFRECRIHSRPRQFLKELFEDYCRYVFVNEHSEDCLNFLNIFVEKTRGWKHFYKMGEGTARFSRITRFRQSKDYHVIGFEDGLPAWFYDQLLQLVQFAWGPIMEHRYCRNLDEGYYQTFNSSKSIVSKLIADYFGLGELIPRTYYAKLEFDGRQRVGVVVETAVGVDPDMLGRKLALQDISPTLQKNLVSLWSLDMICYQKDHRPGNYFIGNSVDGRISSVSAFDNDCPMTLFPAASISFTTYVGVKPMFGKKDIVRIPYLSRKLYDAVAGLNVLNMKKVLAGACSEIEVSKICKRALALRNKMIKNVTSGRLVLLSDDDWSEETMQKELCVSEDTYFSYFVKKHASWN